MEFLEPNVWILGRRHCSGYFTRQRICSLEAFVIKETKCVRCANGDTRTADGFHLMSTGKYKRCADLPPYEQPATPSSIQQLPFQRRVVDWMMETFSMEVCRDKAERNHRFLEEALELVQAMGCTAAAAHMLVDYTFGRPVGDPEQEVGGALVTLAALCAAADISMAELGERELARCWQNIDRIRAKQAGKPRSSPLPGPSPDETNDHTEEIVREFMLQLEELPEPDQAQPGVRRYTLTELEDCLRSAIGRPAVEPTQSRSVQRRVAAMRGESAPEFGPSKKATDDTNIVSPYPGHLGDI